MLVTYDDAGCYYDHVVPPSEGVPNDGASCNLNSTATCDACCGHGPQPFDFRRLGLRVPALLLSPWVPKGVAFQQPRGPTASSQFEHASISASLKDLFNLTRFLTHRDAWAGSFDELLLDKPRTDSPMHLPQPPAPAKPWGTPPGHLRRALKSFSLADEGAAAAARTERHCSPSGAPAHCSTAAATSSATQKQRNQMAILASLTGLTAPDHATTLKFDDADDFLQRAWSKYMEMEIKTDDGSAAVSSLE